METKESKLVACGVYPSESKWTCELFGCGQALTLHLPKEKVPNAFWRFTQRIIFGNKWIAPKE